ncbi:hypothetical protein MBANPS3_001284 [Mucor bainieri]
MIKQYLKDTDDFTLEEVNRYLAGHLCFEMYTRFVGSFEAPHLFQHTPWIEFQKQQYAAHKAERKLAGQKPENLTTMNKIFKPQYNAIKQQNGDAYKKLEDLAAMRREEMPNDLRVRKRYFDADIKKLNKGLRYMARNYQMHYILYYYNNNKKDLLFPPKDDSSPGPAASAKLEIEAELEGMSAIDCLRRHVLQHYSTPRVLQQEDAQEDEENEDDEGGEDDEDGEDAPDAPDDDGAVRDDHADSNAGSHRSIDSDLRTLTNFTHMALSSGNSLETLDPQSESTTLDP